MNKAALIEHKYPKVKRKAFDNQSDDEDSPRRGSEGTKKKLPSFNKYTLTFVDSGVLESEYQELQFFLTLTEIRIAFTVTPFLVFIVGILAVLYSNSFFRNTTLWLALGIVLPCL